MPETRREVAERIIKDNASAFSKKGPATTWVVAFKEAQVIAAIEAALKERDERAARITEAYLSDYRNLLTPSAVAAAIRNEDANAD